LTPARRREKAPRLIIPEELVNNLKTTSGMLRRSLRLLTRMSSG
jgi:hypothetical protein